MTMSINATTRVPTPASDTSATGAATATAAATTSPAIGDEAGFSADLKAPEVRHFPWLSRLTSQLDAVAVQKSPFAGAPMVGETLNQAA
jgi:hypothetical protein